MVARSWPPLICQRVVRLPHYRCDRYLERIRYKAASLEEPGRNGDPITDRSDADTLCRQGVCGIFFPRIVRQRYEQGFSSDSCPLSTDLQHSHRVMQIFCTDGARPRTTRQVAYRLPHNDVQHSFPSRTTRHNSTTRVQPDGSWSVQTATNSVSESMHNSDC
jgi:hypothetical protein